MLLTKGVSSNPAEWFTREQPFLWNIPSDRYEDKLEYYRMFPSSPFLIYTRGTLGNSPRLNSAAMLTFPLYPSDGLDSQRVNACQQQMLDGCIPTVVAYGRLETRLPAGISWTNGDFRIADPVTLLHCHLLEGHHEMYAAATLEAVSGKRGCCSMLVFIETGGLSPVAETGKGNCLRMLSLFSAVPADRPPQQFPFSGPTHSRPLPKSGPFKVALTCLPRGITEESLREWFVDTGVTCEGVELPMEGEAGWAIVSFEDPEDVEKALRCDWEYFPRNHDELGIIRPYTVCISLAGMQPLLEENGRCPLADFVDIFIQTGEVPRAQKRLFITP